jgi:hypothetical protein
MDTISILDPYKGICSDILNEVTTKLSKSFKTFFMEALILPVGGIKKHKK